MLCYLQIFHDFSKYMTPIQSHWKILIHMTQQIQRPIWTDEKPGCASFRAGPCWAGECQLHSDRCPDRCWETQFAADRCRVWPTVWPCIQPLLAAGVGSSLHVIASCCTKAADCISHRSEGGKCGHGSNLSRHIQNLIRTGPVQSLKAELCLFC